jgi:hypothetical protein
VGVPFALVLLMGRPAVVIGIGAALAVVEWLWAYADNSDPASGSEWTGAALVAWTGMFALIGFSLWVAGAVLGGATRQRTRGRM